VGECRGAPEGHLRGFGQAQVFVGVLLQVGEQQ
jgi:uncharacterized protein YjeT (DUF2065 family)